MPFEANWSSRNRQDAKIQINLCELIEKGKLTLRSETNVHHLEIAISILFKMQKPEGGAGGDHTFPHWHPRGSESSLGKKTKGASREE